MAALKLSVEDDPFILRLDYGAQMADPILGSCKCKVRTYFSVKIQLGVVTYHTGLHIYGKRVVDTFLQRTG